MKTISLRLPETLDEELGRRAASRGVSKSDLVREAVAAYLVEDIPPPAKGFLSAAADLVGCIDGGPEDLSYNPEHLAGYGRCRAGLAGHRSARSSPQAEGSVSRCG